MIQIPSHLQCAYCVRNYTHGGECRNPKYDSKGCLVFKMDNKGCIREADLQIEIPLYFDFPPLGVWTDYWSLNGVDTEIKITKIHALKWNSNKGGLIVYCRCEYYENEFHENYAKPKKKPNLKIIK
ncbi:hypothetical protein [Desulforamulus putei]|uniref:hypothetical protein n=1 Tax=Desulforamulus putei TaxID=74701 RepID=UPI001EE3A304|nr:hypothetical protein [Desulforamulus putei]